MLKCIHFSQSFISVPLIIILLLIYVISFDLLQHTISSNIFLILFEDAQHFLHPFLGKV